MSGWIKLHRQFLNWEWYEDHNTSRLFLHLLLSVNHEDKKWQGKVIKAGQIITSLVKLSEQTGLSVRSLRTSIKKLHSTGEVTHKTTNKFTLLTLKKWGNYQNFEQSNDTLGDKPTTNERQTNDNQTTTTKEYKKERTKETKETSKKKTKLQILYEISVPESLGLGFSATWKEWLNYLNEARKLPTATTATKQLQKLEQWGATAAKFAVDKSIECGWKGLFEPTPQELASLQPAAEIQATLAEPVGWQQAKLRYPEETQQRIGDTWEDVPEELKGYLIEDCKKHLTYGEEG